ncbi:lipopolysaccharide assembly protein LapA domain-containing protein [Dactylosporangium sp. NPDC049742]
MSNDFHPARTVPANPSGTGPLARPATLTQQDPTDQAAPPAGSMPRTGAVWFGICAAALFLVVLIVFMLQNTRSIEVTFLWMHGNLPLAMALLVAAVGAAIVTMTVGAARITQLRRLSRRQRR